MNIRWSPPAESVRLADEQPWDGPLAGALRRLTYSTALRSGLAATLMYALAGVSCFAYAAAFPRGRLTVIVVGGVALVSAAGLLALAVMLEPRRFMRAAPGASVFSLVCAGVLITLCLTAGRAASGVTTIFYVEAPIFGFYLFRRRGAVALVSMVAIEYAAALAVQHEPFGRAAALWLVVVPTVTATGVVVGTIAARAEQLSDSEREARAGLADLNANLERRVGDQVEELARLGTLRRFLSPQIADAVSGGSAELLEPHRRRIAVFFSDLRDFTAFTNGAEPEEVVQALTEYYAAVGGVLRRHHATIGGYAGDGIMAYFGDPVVSESPALDALAAVREMQPVLAELCAGWAARGQDLGCGIGLAYGYATLGVVGFDGRYDYTALGAVVNLAARLCARAEPGQVLMDQAMHRETAAVAPSAEVGGFELKGFSADTRVFALGTPKPRPSGVVHLLAGGGAS